MALAYSYIRFSSAAQGLGDSLRRQSSLAEDWCAANGIQMAEDYRDLGVSAFRGRNSDDGALGVFLDGVKDGRIERGSYLLVESLDRVSRAEVERAMAMFLQIVNAGIIVVTLSDGHIYQSGSSQMMIDLMYSLLIMSRAHEESLTKSKRLSAAWSQKRKDAANGGKPMTAQGPSWLKLVKGKWEIIPDKAAVVREIFRLSALGHSYLSVARTLNERGTPTLTKRAKAWRSTTIVHVLDSRSVLGELAPLAKDPDRPTRYRTTVIKDYYPPIVSPALYMQARRCRVTEKSMRGRKSDNIFRGLIRSPEGRPFFFNGKSGSVSKHDYLRIHNTGGTVTGLMSWRYDLFMVDFFDALNNHIDALSNDPTEQMKMESARERLTECESRIGNLVQAIAQSFSKALSAELEKVEAERSAIESEIASMESVITRNEPLHPNDDLDYLSRRIRSLVARIVMDPERKTWEATLVNGAILRSDQAMLDDSSGDRQHRTRRQRPAA